MGVLKYDDFSLCRVEGENLEDIFSLSTGESETQEGDGSDQSPRSKRTMGEFSFAGFPSILERRKTCRLDLSVKENSGNLRKNASNQKNVSWREIDCPTGRAVSLLHMCHV